MENESQIPVPQTKFSLQGAKKARIRETHSGIEKEEYVYIHHTEGPARCGAGGIASEQCPGLGHGPVSRGWHGVVGTGGAPGDIR